MSALLDAQAVQRYLDLLYPDAPQDAWLVVSWLVAKDDFRSQWFRAAQTGDAARFILKQAQHYNVYLGLGVRHPDCTPTPGTRGESPDVYAIGGLWIEFDHNAGVHAAQHLPTPNELLAFIEALPFRFSLLVDSTGGYHGSMPSSGSYGKSTPLKSTSKQPSYSGAFRGPSRHRLQRMAGRWTVQRTWPACSGPLAR